MFHVKRCVGIKSFSDAKWMKKRAAGKIKSFLIQQFFKNVGEVWASSPHLRSKLKLHNERKQKSKRESEESQLPLKLKGCNERQGFRGNCDSQASWGCAPALPNRIRAVFLEATSLRENSLNHPAKGGSTPAFAYQRAAIAPLPCLNLQLGFIKAANSELASFKKCNCNRKNRLQNQFASQMWATRPHLGSIFEKLLHRKTF